jgi:sulfoxide reductase heme-binding subunit YedZ
LSAIRIQLIYYYGKLSLMPDSGAVVAASRTSPRPATQSSHHVLRLSNKIIKPAVFLVALAPLVWLLIALFSDRLGPNPVEAITAATGETGLRLLIVCLSLTPLRWLLKQSWPVRLRRMLGLFSCFYICLHFLTYLVLDLQLDFSAALEDLVERPYILVGTIGFGILLVLAATSTRGWVKRLGRRWQPLHRWVYIAATAGIVHFVWQVKGDLVEPFVYLGILMLLFSYRLVKAVG